MVRLAKFHDAPMKTIITAQPIAVSGVMTWVPNLLPSQPPKVIVRTAPIEAPRSAKPRPAVSRPVCSLTAGMRTAQIPKEAPLIMNAPATARTWTRRLGRSGEKAAVTRRYRGRG